MNRKLLTLLLAAAASGAAAQDAVRGAQLFAETAKLTGRPVPSCTACHADITVLRQMIANHGGKLDDAAALSGWLGAVFAGAQPNAAAAKAQFKGVLKEQDLRDLGAYLAQARRG